MIFCLHFILTMAGYSACGLLLGNYMIRYGGATELDLGFVFMIQPLTILARPFFCARADRLQSHKQLLSWCLFTIVLSYTPFIIIPFLLKKPSLAEILTSQVCFWILVCSHLVGSFSFSGIKSLGDALAVNYAKRIGSDYTSYRKFGALSFGAFGYFLGYINQGWILPDFVPTMIVLVTSMATLLVLVHFWPDEFFVIVGNVDDEKNANQLAKLPVSREILVHIRSKLYRTIFRCSKDNHYQNEVGSTDMKKNSCFKDEQASTEKDETRRTLTTKQQVAIFLLLVRRDIRLPLFLLLLFYGGMVGYAPQNFVFTYMDKVCHQQNICDAASLAGLVMICFCLTETTCYIIINALRSRLNHLVMLEVTLFSLAIHYYFYGFILNHLSPYFFLVESLHGLEYSASLSTSVELGYKFASEVELLVPELIQRGIISKHDNHELVKLSLMATMNACFTLVYDGAGTIMGAFLYGIITDNYSFTTTWIIIGSLATFGFFFVLVVVPIGKCLNVKPQMQIIENNCANPTVV